MWNHGKRKTYKSLLYATKYPTNVLEQLNKCNTIESRMKRVQFATLFQLLSDGRPMVEFAPGLQVFEYLDVLDHWTDGVGWLMVEHMFSKRGKN